MAPRDPLRLGPPHEHLGRHQGCCHSLHGPRLGQDPDPVRDRSVRPPRSFLAPPGRLALRERLLLGPSLVSSPLRCHTRRHLLLIVFNDGPCRFLHRPIVFVVCCLFLSVPPLLLSLRRLFLLLYSSPSSSTLVPLCGHYTLLVLVFDIGVYSTLSSAFYGGSLLHTPAGSTLSLDSSSSVSSTPMNDFFQHSSSQQHQQTPQVARSAIPSVTPYAGNRTVYLGGIHPDVTTKDLCDAIRGGILQNIKYMSEKNIAFITFIEASAALSFFQRGVSENLVLKGKRVKFGWGKPTPLPHTVASAVLHLGASRNVYIGNIDESISEASLRSDFSEFGEIELVNLVPEKNIGFVNFTDIMSAVKAVELMRQQLQQTGSMRVGEGEYTKYKINFGKDRCGNPPRPPRHTHAALAPSMHSMALSSPPVLQQQQQQQQQQSMEVMGSQTGYLNPDFAPQFPPSTSSSSSSSSSFLLSSSGTRTLPNSGVSQNGGGPYLSSLYDSPPGSGTQSPSSMAMMTGSTQAHVRTGSSQSLQHALRHITPPMSPISVGGGGGGSGSTFFGAKTDPYQTYNHHHLHHQYAPPPPPLSTTDHRHHHRIMSSLGLGGDLDDFQYLSMDEY